MRFFSLCFVLAFLCSSALAQQDGGTNGQGGGTTGGGTTGFGTNTGGTGGGGGGGSSATPQGFGSGGVSENVNAAAFGQRGTAIQGFNDITQPGGAFGQNQAINNAGGNRGQFGNLGGFGAGGRGGQQVQRNIPRRIRTQLRLPADFAPEFRILPPARLQSSLTQQYRGIDASQARSRSPLGSSRVFAGADIQVVASGRTVTLRGQVGSDRERMLAERIAKFEPGVDRVVNQLTVVETRP